MIFRTSQLWLGSIASPLLPSSCGGVRASVEVCPLAALGYLLTALGRTTAVRELERDGVGNRRPPKIRFSQLVVSKSVLHTLVKKYHIHAVSCQKVYYSLYTASPTRSPCFSRCCCWGAAWLASASALSPFSGQSISRRPAAASSVNANWESHIFCVQEPS